VTTLEEQAAEVRLYGLIWLVDPAGKIHALSLPEYAALPVRYLETCSVCLSLDTLAWVMLQQSGIEPGEWQVVAQRCVFVLADGAVMTPAEALAWALKQRIGS